MPVTPIETSERQIYRHPKAVCYVADALREADFTEVEYLRCEFIRLAAAPEIDHVHLTYMHGDIVQEGADAVEYFPPQELIGKFVKITIADTFYEDEFAADPDTTVEDLPIVWYGIIENDETESYGTTPENVVTPADGLHARGQQHFTAFGLLRLLEKEVIDSSFIDIDGTEPNILTIKRGLPFNSDPGGAYVRRGNRSTSKVGDSYIFSWEPRGFQTWTAYTAVEYLLARHIPMTALDEPANVWRLESDEEFLSWYDIDLKTDGQTVKSVIDQLIPRQRCVGYFVNFDPETDEIVLKVFTLTDADITLPSGAILKENPDQRELNYEQALDITTAVIADAGMSRYDKVIARGDLRTTTCTLRIEGSPVEYDFTNGLIPAWDSADETEYKAGASGAADYSSLNLEQKQARNAIARSSEKLNEVYRRFCLNQSVEYVKRWNCLAQVLHVTTSDGPYDIFPDIYADPFDPTALGDFRYEHIPSLRLRRDLPLYEKYDYSGTNLADFVYGTAFSADKHPSFIKTFVYAQTAVADEGSGTPARFEFMDKLHRAWSAAGERTWSASVNVLDTEPGLEIVARCPHFLAGTDTTGFAEMADHENHSLQKGISYNDLYATICVELNEHVEAVEILNEPDDPQPVETLIINVPGARHDYVIPYTVVDIKDGQVVQTTSGGAAKDDLKRLKDIARSAAQWYSQKRRTMQLSFRQVRGLFQIGWLITDVGGAYNWTNINTAITAITYDLGRGDQAGTTTIETSYTNLDFQK